jgi:hypothetical protein
MTWARCSECGHMWFEDGGPGRCVRCGGQGVRHATPAVPRPEFVAECLDCPAVRIFEGGIVTHEKPRPLSEWQAAIHRKLGHDVRAV